MKKLITILSLFLAFSSNARTLTPIDTSYHTLTSTRFIFCSKDTSLLVWTGTKYDTLKLAQPGDTVKITDFLTKYQSLQFKLKTDSITKSGFVPVWRLRHQIDSIMALLYIRQHIDSMLLEKIDTSKLAQANGVATLDVNGKVPTSQISDTFMGSVVYRGTWSAVSNSPTLPAAAVGNKGYYYVVTDSAEYSEIVYTNKDWIISNGTSWEKVDNTNSIASVFGRVGNVTAQTGDYNTSQVTENSSYPYFTQARARESISVTTTGPTTGYNSATGVINITQLADTSASINDVYEYEIDTDGLTTKTIPFVLRDKTKVWYNGNVLRSTNWNGMYTNVLNINAVTNLYDYVTICSTGSSVSPYGNLLWKLDGYGNLTPLSTGIIDSWFELDAYGNITPKSTGVDNEYWTTDIYGNLTPI